LCLFFKPFLLLWWYFLLFIFFLLCQFFYWLLTVIRYILVIIYYLLWFIPYTETDVQYMKNCMWEVLWWFRYNSFSRISEIATTFKKWQSSLCEIVDDFDIYKISRKEWTDCYWMVRRLQYELSIYSINSYLVRFDAWWTLKDSYLENGHVWVCVGRYIDWKNWFTLLDPWMMLAEPITFIEWQWCTLTMPNGKEVIVEKKSKGDLPYSLSIDWKVLYFDPYNEWSKVWEPMIRDLLRVTSKFKIENHTPDGTTLWYMVLDLKSESIRFKVNFYWLKREHSFTFKQFQELMNNKQSQEYLQESCQFIWEHDFTDFSQKILNVISITDEYRSVIWKKPPTDT
jgi:hypothetical protein